VNKKVIKAMTFDMELVSLERAFIALAPELARKMNFYAGKAPGIEQKSDGSIVTALDREIELQLRELTSTVFKSPYFFLGEEGEETNPSLFEPVFDNNVLVICDPIDGTTNFVAGKNWFGTLFAVYVKQGDTFIPRFGCVLAAGQQMLYARRDSCLQIINLESGVAHLPQPPAAAIQGKGPLKVSAFQASRQYFDPSMVDFTKRSASIADGLEVFSGTIDVAVMRGKWWDLAAIFAVSELAGNNIYSMRSRCLVNGFTADDFHSEAVDLWKVREPFAMYRTSNQLRFESVLV
jgi:fructose-1,6-bisphosphatase/inositol monophosphatase family enzyme